MKSNRVKISVSRKSSFLGFTLIELLVVIAVVSVLASLLYVLLGSVNGKARGAQSISNLRSMYVAFVNFNSDKGYLPSMTAHYPDAIGGYGGYAFEHYQRQLGDINSPGADGPTIWTDLVPYMGGTAEVAFIGVDKNKPSDPVSMWQTSKDMHVDTSFVMRWCLLQYEANVARRPLRITDLGYPSKQVIFHEYGDWSSSNPTAFYVSPPPTKTIIAAYGDGHIRSIQNVNPASLNFFNAHTPDATIPLTDFQTSWDEY